MPKARATAEQFTATRFATAEEKAKAANTIVAFVDAGCPWSKFTKRLYNTLHCELFGHIAHFNREGFYHEWFRDADARVRFLEHALGPIVYFDGEIHVEAAHGRGDPEHCWSDVECWLITWVRRSGALDRAREERDRAVEDIERAELARLTAKYAETAPPDRFAQLVEMILAASDEASLGPIEQVAGEHWAPEHEALATLRALELGAGSGAAA